MKIPWGARLLKSGPHAFNWSWEKRKGMIQKHSLHPTVSYHGNYSISTLFALIVSGLALKVPLALTTVLSTTSCP